MTQAGSAIVRPSHPSASTAVAIVGGGIAGMGAALSLAQAGMDVTIFESEAELGGNCFGIDVSTGGTSRCRVDAGVSDFNIDSFVRLRALLDDLGVAHAPICQDASFAPVGGVASLYTSGGVVRGPVAAEVADEITRFGRECVDVLEDENWRGRSVLDYVRTRNHSDTFAKNYLYPRVIGCFSAPDDNPESLAIRSIVGFWKMHRLVGEGPARRHAVVGGMHAYCDALQRRLVQLGVRIRCRTRVLAVRRNPGGVELHTRGDAKTEHDRSLADHVIFATPPNLVADLLEDASGTERLGFAGVPFQRARVVVHRDSAVLPRNREAWGAYNYVVPCGQAPRVRPTITFFPSRIMPTGDDATDVLVSLNPTVEPRANSVLAQRWVVHPMAGAAATRAATRIESMQGERNTWHCGSYLREPFLHEQALASGQDVAARLLGRAAIAA